MDLAIDQFDVRHRLCMLSLLDHSTLTRIQSNIILPPRDHLLQDHKLVPVHVGCQKL